MSNSNYEARQEIRSRKISLMTVLIDFFSKTDSNAGTDDVRVEGRDDRDYKATLRQYDNNLKSYREEIRRATSRSTRY